MTTTTTTPTRPVLDLDTVAAHLDHDTATRPGHPRYILGVTDDGTTLWWDPAQDGPFQVVAGSGSGGTTLLRSVAAQALRTGAARIDVIDAKAGACWADLAEVEGCTLYAGDAEGSLDAIRDAAADAEARTAHPDGAAGPHRFVIVDELELTARALEEAGAAQARHALADLYLHGSQVGVHLVARSHRPAALLPRRPHRTWRDTMAVARLPRNQVRRLADGAPLPPGGGQSGRWLITGRTGWPVITSPAALIHHTAAFTRP